MNLNNLTEIKELYDIGAISYEEYENLKYKILGLTNPKEVEKRKQEEAKHLAEQRKRDELQEKEEQLRKVEIEQRLQAERLIEERKKQEAILEQIKEKEESATKVKDTVDTDDSVEPESTGIIQNDKKKTSIGAAIIATILFAIAIILIGFCLIVVFTVEGAFDGPASVFLLLLILAFGLTALVGGIKVFKHL